MNMITLFWRTITGSSGSGLRQLMEGQSHLRVMGEAATGLEAVAAARDVPARHRAAGHFHARVERHRSRAADRVRMRRQCRVIMLSMHSDRRYIREALRAGAKGYLLKDAAPEELLRAISACMRGQFYLSAQINEQVISDFVQTRPPGGRILVHPAERPRAGSAATAGRGQVDAADRGTAESQREDRGNPPPAHHGQAEFALPSRPDPLRDPRRADHTRINTETLKS